MAVTTPHPVALSALADETRWDILVRLGSSPASASRLAAEFPVSRQAIAKHISVLQGAGLVVPERVGREVRFVALGSKLSQLAPGTRADSHRVGPTSRRTQGSGRG